MSTKISRDELFAQIVLEAQKKDSDGIKIIEVADEMRRRNPSDKLSNSAVQRIRKRFCDRGKGPLAESYGGRYYFRTGTMPVPTQNALNTEKVEKKMHKVNALGEAAFKFIEKNPDTISHKVDAALVNHPDHGPADKKKVGHQITALKDNGLIVEGPRVKGGFKTWRAATSEMPAPAPAPVVTPSKTLSEETGISILGKVTVPLNTSPQRIAEIAAALQT